MCYIVNLLKSVCKLCCKKIDEFKTLFLRNSSKLVNIFGHTLHGLYLNLSRFLLKGAYYSFFIYFFFVGRISPHNCNLLIK